jgi:hypothetical protein
MKESLLYECPWGESSPNGESQRYEGENYEQKFDVTPNSTTHLLSFQVNYVGLMFLYDLLLNRHGHEYQISRAVRLAPNALFIEFYSDLTELEIRQLMRREPEDSDLVNKDYHTAVFSLQKGPIETNTNLNTVDLRYLNEQEVQAYIEAVRVFKSKS